MLEQSAATLEPFPDGTTISGTWVNGRCTIVVDISTCEDGEDTDDDGGGSRSSKKRRTAEGSGRGNGGEDGSEFGGGEDGGEGGGGDGGQEQPQQRLR